MKLNQHLTDFASAGDSVLNRLIGIMTGDVRIAEPEERTRAACFLRKCRWSVFMLAIVAFMATVPGPDPVRASSDNTIRLALLPIIDSFPYHVAETTGEFKKSGIRVRLIPVMSALDRDQLMQAGEIDGMLNEMTSAANFNRTAVQVKVVYTIRSARPNFPMFRLVASPRSPIRAVSDLSGASIGISRHTIIEYVTDRLLEAERIQPAQVQKRSIPSIPERFQLLMQGQIDAATLPDPLASAALAAGARLISDDASHSRYSVSLLTFSLDAIQQKAEPLKRFFMAWDRAVVKINADPESFRGLMLKKIRVPPNVRETYPIPVFSRNTVPDREQWDDVMRWMVAGGLLKTALPYEASVSKKLLPAQPSF